MGTTAKQGTAAATTGKKVQRTAGEDAFQMALFGTPPGAAEVKRLAAQAPIILDYFAGGGGVSHGIERALGRCPDVAINHDPKAIEMHARNHQKCKHFIADVFDVDPEKNLPPGPVGMAWFSPSCVGFSHARGGKECAPQLRGHAWVVIKVAKARRPAVIFVENVAAFLKWVPEGEEAPKDGNGREFDTWCKALEDLGYVAEYRVLDAADYGAPTHRRRLILIARADGQPIVWPEPTHGPGRLHPYRSAASCINWSIPCPSIFGKRRPLAPKTMARVADGLRRFLFTAPEPFLVPMKTWSGEGNTLRSLERPMQTTTCSEGGEYAGVNPLIVRVNHGGDSDRSNDVNKTMPIITQEHGFALVNASIVSVGYGESCAQAPRTRDIERPIGTIVTTGKNALLHAWIAKAYEGSVGNEATDPLTTITTIDHHQIVTASINKFYGTSTGSDLRTPMPTVTASGQHLGVIETRMRHAASADKEATTTVPDDWHPGRIAEAATFLREHFKDSPRPLLAWVDQLLTDAEQGYVTTTVGGERFMIVDIGLRMFSPEELARCQGFEDGYILTGTQAERIARIGNSVPPPLAQAVVAANVKENRSLSVDIRCIYEPRIDIHRRHAFHARHRHQRQHHPEDRQRQHPCADPRSPGADIMGPGAAQQAVRQAFLEARRLRAFHRPPRDRGSGRVPRVVQQGQGALPAHRGGCLLGHPDLVRCTAATAGQHDPCPPPEPRAAHPRAADHPPHLQQGEKSEETARQKVRETVRADHQPFLSAQRHPPRPAARTRPRRSRCHPQDFRCP
jgi:DNA (cytosine-5)-methyltransferase 1